MAATVVITGADVFCAADHDHPIASVRRIGGGRFEILLPGHPVLRDPQTGERLNRLLEDSYEEALSFCEAIAYHVEADPRFLSPMTVHTNAELAAARQVAIDAEARAEREEQRRRDLEATHRMTEQRQAEHIAALTRQLEATKQTES